MEFLERLNNKFELVIFTASMPSYANAIVDKIDPSGRLISHILTREHCSVIDGLHIKDLAIIKNRSPSDMMIIDNIIYSFALHMKNGIPIKSYICGSDDNELKFIADTFENMKNFMDCVEFIKNRFKLDKFYEFLCC